MLNSFQRACANAYAVGDFAHVADLEQARAAGDTLFTFLMIELSTSEGRTDAGEAERRLAMAIGDLERVAEAVQRAGEPPASGGEGG